jgi:hypothetical protein
MQEFTLEERRKQKAEGRRQKAESSVPSVLIITQRSVLSTQYSVLLGRLQSLLGEFRFPRHLLVFDMRIDDEDHQYRSKDDGRPDGAEIESAFLNGFG